MPDEMVLPTYKCLRPRCRHVWVPRMPRRPAVCPGCGSTRWDEAVRVCPKCKERAKVLYADAVIDGRLLLAGTFRCSCGWVEKK